MKNIILLLTGILLINYSGLFSQDALYQPYNLDIELAEEGKLPEGWTMPEKVREAGYVGYATDENPYEGNYCLQLFYNEDQIDEGAYGSIMQSINATPYIGKRIRISGAVRAEIGGPQGSARLWISERMANYESSYIDIMEDNPIVINTWERYSLEYTVSDDAAIINFGLLLFGKGIAWLDDVEIEILDKIEDIEGPKKLDKNELSYLKSYAKLYGNIKFFHPSKQAYNADWETFQYNTLKAVSKVESNNQLKDTLKKYFQYIAPAIDLNNSRYKYEKPKEAFPEIGIAYKTRGIYNKEAANILGTNVINVYNSQRVREAAAFQTLSGSEFAGNTIEFSAKVKADLLGLESNAQLWMRFDIENSSEPVTFTMDKNPIKSSEWKTYTLKEKVPKDCDIIRIGLVLVGDGEANFDDIEVNVIKNGIKGKAVIDNHDFETPTNNNDIYGWTIPYSSVQAGYEFTTKGTPDNRYLSISTNEDEYIKLPKPGDFYTQEIGNGLTAQIPVCLFAGEEGTLPFSSFGFENKVSLSRDDRISRIATAIDFWNYLHSFSLIDINEQQWDSVLTELLVSASEADNHYSFDSKLGEVAALTNDSQTRIWHIKDNFNYTLPLMWDWLKGELIITKSYTPEIKEGWIVKEFNGNKIDELLNEMKKEIPGSNDRWKILRAITFLRTGSEESQVNLKVKTPTGNENISLTRSESAAKVRFERPRVIEELDSLLLYIDATRISDSELKDIVGNISIAKGLIIDLRGISLLSEHFLGFFLDMPIRTANWSYKVHTSNKPQYQIIEGTVKPRSENLTPNVVFICNDRSIGYSEIILELVKKYEIGKIIGTETAGSPGQVTSVRLPSGYNLSLNVINGSYFDGESMQQNSVIPDIILEGNEDYPYDPQIKKALEILKSNL